MLRFDGRVAVVTGAGGGLGKEYALLLASRGCKVVVNDLGGGRDGSGASSNAADKVVQEIKAKGGEATANYNSVEDGERIIETAIKAYGRVDIVINNAGILRDKAFVNMTEAEFDIIHKVHLKGSFSVTKAAWPYMRKQNYGKVIMTASAAGIFGNFGQANYSSAKLALLGLSNTLAIEGRKYNIAVNTVVPTAASRLTEDIMPPEIFEKLKPHFVSPVTVWLCHEDCPENGGCFEAAGGFVAKYQFFRSAGKAFINEDLTLENLRARWDQVTSLQGARALASIQEQTISVVQALSGEDAPALSPAQTAQSAVEDESIFRYNIDTSILYNLSVGVSTRQPDHLKFLYENAEEFSIIPSFGVIPPMNAVFTSKELHEAVSRINGDPARMLHGEQFLELYKPLPPSATVKTDVRIVDVLDKGSGAVVVIDADTFDVSTGEKVAYSQWLVFFVGAGKFGGPRSSHKVIPTAEIPKREPDVVLEDRTSIDQAALYRLCGDKNPLHIDPQFAAMGGWSQPIMHGLCSLGFSTRHVMKAFADNDMSKFKSLKVRFTGPVIPGETVRTRMWREGNRILFESVAVESGKTVIGGGVIELKSTAPAPSPAIPAQKPTPVNMSAGQELKTDLVFEGMGFRVEDQPDLASKIQAIYEYNITKDGKTVSTWTLDLKNGQGSVYKGACKEGKPNCVITISDDDMFSMAVGELDPQKAFMTGKLKVRGNIMLMQKLRLLLKPPPEKKQESPVSAPASAPAGKGALRCKVIFANTNEKISKSPELAADIQTIFQFDILQGGNLAYQYTLDLKNGGGCGYEGPAKEKPDCILIMEDEVLDKVHSGKLDAQRAFMSQKLKVKGNVLASQKLADLWADERDREESEEAANLPGVPASSQLSAPPGTPKIVKADFIFNIFLYHLHQDPAMGEHIAGLVKCMYHWVILKKGKKASEWTSDLKSAKGDLYNEAPRNGANPEVQITIDDEDLVLLMLGKLNPQKAFMQGRLKIKGNIMLMQKFNVLWQEILKSGRVVELKLMEPLLSDGQPLSEELWSDYQFFIVTQRLAHLPQLVEASKKTAYHFVITKDGAKRSEWTIDLSKHLGAVYRGGPKDVSSVCKITLDDLAFHYLVQGAQTAQQTFAQAEITNRSALDAIAPLFLAKAKL